MIKVSVVILTWNSQDMVDACVSSLASGLALSPFEVIVVDNGSRDDTLAVVRSRHPEVRVLSNPSNRGVAPARNQGMRVACGEYVILLDDDTVVHAGAFDQLVAYMDAHADVGLCGPQLVDLDGSCQLSCRLFPTLPYKLLRRVPFSFARALMRKVEMADWDHATVRDVDYVIGACQAIRRSALAQIGLLDERIFYGPEDVDVCLRLQQAGWRVVYHPDAVVEHHERRMTRSALSSFSFLGRQHLRGLLYYFWKHGYWLSRRRLYARLPAQSAGYSATSPAAVGAPEVLHHDSLPVEAKS
ncbi:MAG: glycosyltransferase family 2 protein [Deltaproteobacteria bacterium]|nr:glycosyltransferase family 2 protein [Deltaproteobacteria bacterium]